MTIDTGTPVYFRGPGERADQKGEWHRDDEGECVLLEDGERIGVLDLLTQFWVIRFRNDLLELGHVNDSDDLLHFYEVDRENAALHARLAELDAPVPDAGYRDTLAEAIWGEDNPAGKWSDAEVIQSAPFYALADRLVQVRSTFQQDLLRDYERATVNLRAALKENATLRTAQGADCVRYHHIERLNERQLIIDRQGRTLARIGYTDNGTWSPDPQTRARIEQLEAALANVKPTEGGD
jgi:hypothetical protein